MGTPPDAGVEVGYCLLVQPLRNHQSQTVIMHILVPSLPYSPSETPEAGLIRHHSTQNTFCPTLAAMKKNDCRLGDAYCRATLEGQETAQCTVHSVSVQR